MASQGSVPNFKETTFAVANQPARKYVMHSEMHTNWQESVDYCKGEGMQLLEFESEEMYNKVWEWLGDDVSSLGEGEFVPGYWIGYKERNNGQTINPASKRDFEPYTNWWTGEPNDKLNPGQNKEDPGNEQCVRMRKKAGETGTMNDAPCNFTWAGNKNDSVYMSFICQDTYDFGGGGGSGDGGEAPLCPSEFFGAASDGCYVQNMPWTAHMTEDIICTMENDACLNVSCSAGGIYAKLRHDLFHENLKHPGRFTDQLALGQAVLTFGGQEVHPVGDGVLCPYTISADGEFIILDWPYDICEVQPELATSDKCGEDANNAIQYKVSVKSYGNDRDSSDMIEFYVDTTVDVSCTYCNSFSIKGDGFWINQEDVSMTQNAVGKLDSLFNCNLYADSARQSKIEEHNIVNMGEFIYGEVTSSANLPGLKYKLVEFKVSDASGANKGDFLVIDGGQPQSVVKAALPGGDTANTGESLLFEYLSFGFDNLSEQNELDHTCKIIVELA